MANRRRYSDPAITPAPIVSESVALMRAAAIAAIARPAIPIPAEILGKCRVRRDAAAAPNAIARKGRTVTGPGKRRRPTPLRGSPDRDVASLAA